MKKISYSHINAAWSSGMILESELRDGGSIPSVAIIFKY